MQQCPKIPGVLKLFLRDEKSGACPQQLRPIKVSATQREKPFWQRVGMALHNYIIIFGFT
jgi:hypothetical protein